MTVSLESSPKQLKIKMKLKMKLNRSASTTEVLHPLLAYLLNLFWVSPQLSGTDLAHIFGREGGGFIVQVEISALVDPFSRILLSVIYAIKVVTNKFPTSLFFLSFSKNRLCFTQVPC